MDELIGFLIPVIIIISIVVRAVKGLKKEETTTAVRRDEKWQYVASQNDLRKFLHDIGVETGEAPQAGTQPHMVTPATPRAVEAAQSESPTGVTPGAPRRRAPRQRVPHAPQQPAPAARRVGEQAEPLEPSVDKHVHEHVSREGEAAPAPAFEGRYVASDEAAAKQAGETGQRKAPVAKAAGPARVSRAATVRKRIRLTELGQAGLRQGIILSEILSPPIALRGERRY